MFEPVGIPEDLIGQSSFEALKVNGHMCNALFDSSSQVSIIFDSWYKRYLSDIIQPVSRLDIFVLSDSSYPYLGHVVVEVPTTL